MVIIPVKEEFETLLLTVSLVIDHLEQRKYTFIAEVRAFISRVEKTAEKYRLPFAAEAGLLRGKLYAIDEAGGFAGGSGYNPETRRAQRRNRETFALQRLDEACKLVRAYFASAEVLFGEAVNLCRQIGSVAQAKGLLNDSRIPETTGTMREVELAALWTRLKRDEDLCSLCTHITGLVGIHNTLILLDRALADVGA